MPVRNRDGGGRRQAWLLGLCTALPLIEMGVLVASGQARVDSLSPQVTAVPPFAIFHDLRWLFVYHHSWFSFAYEWAALMVFRSTVTAALIRAAWPAGYTPPGWGAALGRAMTFDLVAFVLFSPLVVLIFASGATGLAWPWYAGIIPMVLFSMVSYPWVITGDWSRWPTWNTIGWVVLTWPILAVAGGAILLVPLWAGFLLTALFGAFNAMAWSSVTAGMVLARRPYSFRPLPVAAVVVIYGLLLGVLAWGAGAETSSLSVPTRAQVTLPGPGKTMMVILGLDSTWGGRSLPDVQKFAKGGMHTTIFSYRGLGPDDRPLPYPPQDTRVPLYASVKKLERQINSLVTHGNTPIWILADSEGSLITQLYLASHPGAPVKRVIVTSPEIAAATVYFPEAGHVGWGAVTGLVVQGWLHYFETMGWPAGMRVVLRTMLQHGPVMTQLERCPMGVSRHQVLLPLTTTVTMPFDLATQVPIYVAGIFHGGLLSGHHFGSAIATVLKGDTPSQSGWWNAGAWLGRASGSAWRVPPLVRTFPAPWRLATGTAALDCRVIEAHIRRSFAEASAPGRAPATQ